MLTDDSKYECVGEVSVQGQLDQVSPQPKELHRLGQANEDVTECQGLYLITRAQQLPNVHNLNQTQRTMQLKQNRNDREL